MAEGDSGEEGGFCALCMVDSDGTDIVGIVICATAGMREMLGIEGVCGMDSECGLSFETVGDWTAGARSVIFRYPSTPRSVVSRSTEALISRSKADTVLPLTTDDGAAFAARMGDFGFRTRFHLPKRPIVLTNALDTALCRAGKT